MKRCTRCLYTDAKPDLIFDQEGVCSACRNFEKRRDVNWTWRKGLLESLLEKGRNDSGYDCIVPSSGGKDSHWQVLTLIEMGARPLVVTATTCHLTPMGRANIDNLSRYATTIEVTPNREVRAKLNRIGLTMVGDISWPEHLAIFTTPFRVAAQTGIPLIFYGECPQREYGGPPGAEDAYQMTRRWVSEYGGLLGLRSSDMVGADGITEADMEDYTLPGDAAFAEKGIEAHFLGQYIEWDSHRNARVAQQHGMWQTDVSPANWWPHENLDNAQTGLHDHLMYRKFGFGRLAAQISVDVRRGLISREEAHEIVQERDGLFPEVYAGVPIEDVLDRLKLSRADLEITLNRFTNWEIFGAGAARDPRFAA